LKGRY